MKSIEKSLIPFKFMTRIRKTKRKSHINIKFISISPTLISNQYLKQTLNNIQWIYMVWTSPMSMRVTNVFFYWSFNECANGVTDFDHFMHNLFTSNSNNAVLSYQN